MPLVRLSSIGENFSASPTTAQLRLALSFKPPHRPARLLDQSPPNMELPKEDSNGSGSGHDTRTGTSSKPRSRSLSIRGSNPLDCPLTKSDLELSALRKQILTTQDKETAVENALDARIAQSTASPLSIGRELLAPPAHRFQHLSNHNLRVDRFLPLVSLLRHPELLNLIVALFPPHPSHLPPRRRVTYINSLKIRRKFTRRDSKSIERDSKNSKALKPVQRSKRERSSSPK